MMLLSSLLVPRWRRRRAGHRPRTSTRLPIQPGREDIADDRCPICTLIHLAGALVPAEMPSLPLPTVFGRLRLELAAEFDLTASHAALFRARAPPIA
jgi:hypothetical protein